ncbi:glycine-rich domain-containing protein [Micromonospora sp. CPCC 205558]|uniref:glycine-rich domain-containing protein n=1 Tax=Micromonospora sp. CPCC 205558 TaxID=3122403 RepID=UPI002FF3C16F
MTVTALNPPLAVKRGTSLVSPELFARLTDRIAKDHPELSADMPARILDQALAFLSAAAVTTTPIGPSALVDIGWHTFILHTRDYAEFCDRIAGRFIHHEPEDGSEWPTAPTSTSVPLDRAIHAISEAGYQIDRSLWRATADCTQCHAGCTDSPTR